MTDLEQQPVEIELKYQVVRDSPYSIEYLIQWLDNNAMNGGEDELKNIYFDTPNGVLHKHQMGLRIRRWIGGAEQTLKLAGKQLGARSERPEFNYPMQADKPDLLLFPSHIWPLGWPLHEVNESLQKQFEIVFVRKRWLYTDGDLVVEIALDQGDILAGQQQAAILELELELKAGKAEQMFALGERLAQQFHFVAGLKSKAQRGFELLQKSNPA